MSEETTPVKDGLLAEQQQLTEQAADLATLLEQARDKAYELGVNVSESVSHAAHGGEGAFMIGLTVFVLACFVGYHVVWRVTPALHAPLMWIPNSISSVIIVGAIIALGAVGKEGTEVSGFSQILAFLAVTLASVNIFGGFIITRRMLHMFKKKG